MSKSQDIRDALAGGALTFKQLHEKVGGTDKQLLDLCCYLRTKGQVKIGSDEDKTITPTGRRGAPPQARRAASGKKSAGKKKGGRKTVRSYRQLADKTVNGHKGGGGYQSIVLENLVGAGVLLRQAVEDGVELDANNFGLKHAMDNYERAAKLYKAAQQ